MDSSWSASCLLSPAVWWQSESPLHEDQASFACPPAPNPSWDPSQTPFYPTPPPLTFTFILPHLSKGLLYIRSKNRDHEKFKGPRKSSQGRTMGYGDPIVQLMGPKLSVKWEWTMLRYHNIFYGQSKTTGGMRLHKPFHPTPPPLTLPLPLHSSYLILAKGCFTYGTRAMTMKI